MTQPSLIIEVLEDQKQAVLTEMEQRLGELPRSPYRDFLLSPKGKMRLMTWLDLLIGALKGDEERFLEDQNKAGYERAHDGFQWKDASLAYLQLLESCLAVAFNHLHIEQTDSWRLFEDSRDLIRSYFRAYAAIGASFLHSREDIIRDQISVVQQVLEFTKKVIATFEVDSIVDLAVTEISLIFDSEVFVTLTRHLEYLRANSSRRGEPSPLLATAMGKCLGNAVPYFVDRAGRLSADIDAFNPKEIVAVPFGIHDRVLGTVALTRPERGVCFERRELAILSQFLHIASLALENAYMVERIDQSRRELRLLTDKIMTVREEQKRVLAEDIHDTVAQDLAGIGYTIQFVSELARTNPQLVAQELDGLLETVNRSVNRCRQLMSSLRPDLIDTLGLAPALGRLADHFSEETGIAVSSDLPEEFLELSRDLSICLYRVAEEALRNVRKHAAALNVRLSLREDGEDVILSVSDDGKGSDVTREIPWSSEGNKFGLLFMRRRVEALGGSLTISTAIDQGWGITAVLCTSTREDSSAEHKDHDR